MTRALAVCLAAAALGSACGPGAECGFEPQCAGLTAYYACAKTEVARIECPAQQFCSMDAAKQLPACVGGYTVSGTATYAKRAQTTAGLAAPVQTPIPDVSLAVVDDVGNVMGTGFTDAEGHFTLAYQPLSGVTVHVMIFASADPTTGVPLTVNARSGIFGYGAPPFVSEPTHAQDIAVTEDEACEPFNVYATAFKSFKYLKTLTSVSLTPLTYLIYPGYAPSCGSCYYSDTNTIHLEFTADNSDGFDDAVIDHEFGHYVQNRVSMSDSAGGSHNGSPASPLLAWGEGYATYYSSSARHNELYIDTFADPGSPNGYASYVFSLRSNLYPAVRTLPMTQNLSEWLIAEILWTLEDTATPGLSKPPTATMDILGKVVRQGHVDRGVTGFDLVDFLDEWFIQRGLDDCAAFRTLLATKRFPYDFQAPGAACP